MTNNEQTDLITAAPPESEVFFQQLEETTGDYTAERFRSRRPDDFKLVVTMLAQGHGAQRIADSFKKLDKKLSKNTVKAVRASAGETIELLRNRLAAESFIAADDYRAAALLVLDEIMNSPARRSKLTIRDVQSLEVASGIAAQNGQLLSGLPTARVSVEDLRRPDHEDFNRQLAALPAIDIPATTLNPIDPPSTHLAEKTPEQKEARTGESHAAPVTDDPTAPKHAPSDSESDAGDENNQ